jgi:hypothetical protein
VKIARRVGRRDAGERGALPLAAMLARSRRLVPASAASLLSALALALVALAALLPSAASAHAGDNRYRSIVHGIAPAIPGLTVQVLDYDDQLLLTNHSDRDVTVLGYDREPYARVDADGTVSVNTRSPAYYLNDDRYGTESAPADVSAHPHATPVWKVLDRTGVFQWHDHRMHYMSRGVAPQVRDQSVRTKVFDYDVPLEVSGRVSDVSGTLWWVGPQGGGLPVAAIVALAVVALLSVAAAVIVRRRRAGAGGGDGERQAEASDGPRLPAREAW